MNWKNFFFVTVALLSTSAAADNDSIALKPGLNTLAVMELPGSGLDVYGIEWEYRGDGKSVVGAESYQPFNDKGEKIALPLPRFDRRFGGVDNLAVQEWRKARVELLCKNDWRSLGIVLRLSKGGKAEVRKLKIVKGGYPPNAIFPPAPYVDWIMDLRPNLIYAAEMRAQQPDTANKEKFIKLMAPYMRLPLAELLRHVPELSFEWRRGDYEYDWDIAAPDALLDKKGGRFDFKAAYPKTGSEEVTGLKGRKWHLDYHDGGKGRIYHARFLDTAKFIKLSEVAMAMAELYRITGGQEYAVRSAALLHELWKNAGDWPVYGRRGYNLKPEVFFPPDSYEYWFSSVLGGFSEGWYIPATSGLKLPSRNLSLLKSAPAELWQQVNAAVGSSRAQMDIAENILDLTRQSLLRDAYQRSNPWALYHNTIGGQIRTFTEVADAIGCPELASYAWRKFSAASEKILMADGMFPESTGYFIEYFEGGFAKFIKEAKEYRHPSGYAGETRDFTIPPLTARAYQVLKRLTFPDGSRYVINDTYAESCPRIPFTYRPDLSLFRREINDSLLIPDFGFSAQGWGKGKDQVETHLKYSGFGNHGHFDLLNLTIWAYGDEIVSDLGYTRFNDYRKDSAAHNLVVVDTQVQLPGGRGDLRIWSDPHPSAVKFQRAGQNPAEPVYRQASVYQRTLVSLPFAPGQAAVADFFSVKGGKCHDYMTHGAADYPQKVTATLENGRKLDNLAGDGKAISESKKIRGGQRSPHYGAFRNLNEYPNRQAWSVTVSPGLLSADIPGIGQRAASGLPSAGFRLHYLSPLDGNVFIGEAPRQRFLHESAHAEEQRRTWASNVMPKIVARRQGTALNSLFTTVYEPFSAKPWLEKLEMFNDIPAASGVGMLMEGDASSALLLYRAENNPKRVSHGQYSTDADIAVWRRVGETQYLDIAGAGMANSGGLSLHTRSWPVLKAVATGRNDQNEDYLLVEGDLSGYPDIPEHQPHAGKFVCFRQKGHSSWWLPVKFIQKQNNGQAKIIFSREIGFEFDSEDQLLTEKFFSFRHSFGSATVELPVTSFVCKDGDRVECVLSSPAVLRFAESRKVKNIGDLKFSSGDGFVDVTIPLESTRHGHLQLRIETE